MSGFFKSILAAGLIAGTAFSVSAEEARVTGHQSAMIGETRVTALYRGYVTGSANQAQVAYAYKRLTSDLKTAPSSLTPGIAAFVVDTGDKVTLICLGSEAPTPAVQGYVMSSLVAAGYSPDDIDEIITASGDSRS